MKANEFNLYREVVRRSGIAERIEERLCPTGTGAPRALSVEVLLAALMASSQKFKSLLVTKVYETVTTELARSFQVELGIRRHAGADPIDIHRFYYLLAAIARAYQYMPNQNPTVGWLDKARPATKEERAERQAALQAIVDDLLSATSAFLDEATQYAVDGTSIKSASKGKRRLTPERLNAMTPRDRAHWAGRPTMSADPDADFGHRTATYDDNQETFFGYTLTAFTRIAKPGAHEQSQPILTESILFHPANEKTWVPVVQHINTRKNNGHAIDQIVVDRGYSDADPNDWAQALRDADVQQVFDLKKTDHGARPDTTHGFIVLDGWPHDPSVPKRLHKITRPNSFTLGTIDEKTATDAAIASYEARKKEIATFNKLIAERSTYAYTLKDILPSGALRFSCPGKVGKLNTRGCQHSIGLNLNPTIPTSKHPAGINPTACTQNHLTIAPHEVSTKHFQRDYWGGLKWQRSYNRRTAVEEGFGILKGRATGPIQRGWTQQRGLVKTLLLITAALAAVNVRNLLSWSRETGDITDPICQVDLTDYGFEENEPHTGLVSGSSPPK